MNERGTHFVALIIVVLAAWAAALLLLVALVVWLAEWFGSLILPSLLVGVSLLLLAVIVYKLSLRRAIEDIGERVEVIYDVTKRLREAVEWCIKLFAHP